MKTEQKVNNALSQSKLWDMQREYYKSLVVSDAWGKDVIPFFKTSNNFIANIYVQIIKKIIDNSSDTLYIVELGSGHGRFGYLLQNALKNSYKQSSKLYHHIMTDLSQKNIDTWKNNPSMQTFIEDGTVDFALFDISQMADTYLEYGKESLFEKLQNKSVLVISNFVTSALAFDVFNIKNGQLYECSVHYDKNIENSAPKDFNTIMKNQELSFEMNKIEDAYYDIESLNDIIEKYKAYYDNATIDIPMDMICCMKHFINLSSELSLLLSDDANLSLEFFKNRKPRVYKLNSGSFSNRINLDALSHFMKSQGLNFLSPVVPNASFDTYAFIPEKFNKIEEVQSIIESYSSNDFSVIYKQLKSRRSVGSKELLALLKMSCYDANIIKDFYEKLLELSSRKDRYIKGNLIYALKKVWNNYYDIGETFNMGFALGRLFRRLKDYESALKCFSYALSKNVEDYNTHYYLGLCYQLTQRYEQAIEHYQAAVSLKGVYKSASIRIEQCQDVLVKSHSNDVLINTMLKEKE